MISFHLRPCLLKLAGNLFKYLILATILGQNSVKRFFTIERKNLRALSNVLHILNQCNKTFQMCYQQTLYAFCLVMILVILLLLILKITLLTDVGYSSNISRGVNFKSFRFFCIKYILCIT